MASHFLDLISKGPKNGKSLLLLCHYARFRVCSSSSSSSSSNSSSSIYWPMCIPAQRNNHHGQMGNHDFLISVATNKSRFELELRINNDRVCFSVAFYEISRFSFNNFDDIFNFLEKKNDIKDIYFEF